MLWWYFSTTINVFLEAQWLSGRVLDLRQRGRGFETDVRGIE